MGRVGAGTDRQLTEAGLRAEIDERDTLGYRIRYAETMKIPYMGIVGEREAEAGTVSVRKRGAKKKQVTMERGSSAAAEERGGKPDAGVREPDAGVTGPDAGVR